jgi:hypothetical protein
MKIMAAMSLPRLCFTDNVFSAMRVFSPMDIPVVRGGTVYWEQGLSRALERGIEEGYDLAFTLDYDSIFMRCHVEAMIDIMETNDWIDCLVPIQMRRTYFDRVMFQNTHNETGIMPADKRDSRVSPIRTGHFGLTAFRLKALSEVPRPWLVSEPDADGRWGEGRKDADMGFWLKWLAAGKKVKLANNVRIGHMQLTSIWPDSDLQPYEIEIDRINMMEDAS